jgi:hypothetical protein
LRDHVDDRYIVSAAGSRTTLRGTTAAEVGLDCFGPVCLVEVDFATARHTLEYQGRAIAFFAPSCRRQLRADPHAYLPA